MATMIYAPDRSYLEDGRPTVFLAGSIEQGKARQWQQEFADLVRDLDIVLVNPRRQDWDPSWPQEASFPKFREQVEWEREALGAVDLTILYFDPETTAPISLLELGEYGPVGNMAVCCPEGYYRRGNVQIMCEDNAIPMRRTIEGLARWVRRGLQIAEQMEEWAEEDAEEDEYV